MTESSAPEETSAECGAAMTSLYSAAGEEQSAARDIRISAS